MRYLFISILFLASCAKPQEEQTTSVEDPFPHVESRNLGYNFRDFFNKIAADSKKTLESDPTNVEAMAALAEANITNWLFGFTGREATMPEARTMATKAVELDATNINALTVMGITHMCDYEWEQAEETLLKAIAIDSNAAKPNHWYALYLSAMGEFDKALMHSEKAIELDPNVGYNVGKGAVLYFAHRFDDLKAQMKLTVSQDTTIAWGYDWLGMAYVELHEFDSSVVTYRKAVELADGTMEVMSGLGHALGLAGQTEEAREIAEFMAYKAETAHVPPVQRAYVHFSFDDVDGAMELMELAYEQKAWELAFMQQEPWFDQFRDNVRFMALLDKMNFPE